MRLSQTTTTLAELLDFIHRVTPGPKVRTTTERNSEISRLLTRHLDEPLLEATNQNDAENDQDEQQV